LTNRAKWEALTLASPGVLLVVAFFLVPIGHVLWLSFSFPTLGFHNYVPLKDSSGLRVILYTTFQVCFLTTVICCVLGYVVALSLVYATDRMRKLMFFLILVPFWLSGLVRTFAWLMILRRDGVVNTVALTLGLSSEPLPISYNMFAVLIGMVHYMLPYAILPMYSNMREIDRQLVRAARGLGASRDIAFRKVFFPLSMPGVAAAASLVFILSLGFYVLPFILGGGRVTMIGEYIAVNMLDTANWGVSSMLAVVLLIIVLIIYGATRRLVGRSGRLA
jgi:putative spermidine/putrescine transport system permease protein